MRFCDENNFKILISHRTAFLRLQFTVQSKSGVVFAGSFLINQMTKFDKCFFEKNGKRWTTELSNFSLIGWILAELFKKQIVAGLYSHPVSMYRLSLDTTLWGSMKLTHLLGLTSIKAGKQNERTGINEAEGDAVSLGVVVLDQTRVVIVGTLERFRHAAKNARYFPQSFNFKRPT